MLSVKRSVLGEPTNVVELRLRQNFEWRSREGLRLFYHDAAMRKFLSYTKEVSAPGPLPNLLSRPILQAANDSELDDVLRPEVLPSHLAALIEAQSKGNEGYLLVTGQGNRFVIGELVVNMYWNNVKEHWVVYPWERGVYRWFGGGQTFSSA